MHPIVVIVGLGEVGKPLLEIMKCKYQTFVVDIDQPASISRCNVMHVCFPFQSEKFCRQAVEYIDQYRPALTVINSTVAPGTTRSIAVESGNRSRTQPGSG
jgi:UDP-N-acetyl-D-mannosaminuronate dehydrogenase